MKNVLHLTLKKKWFDMVLSGEKTEEYREIKPYWIDRFLRPLFSIGSMEADQHDKEEFYYDVVNYEKTAWDSHYEMLKFFQHEVRDYDLVKFVNGYGADRPAITLELKKIIFGDGKPEWGAEKDKRYFCLLLGDITERINCQVFQRLSNMNKKLKLQTEANAILNKPIYTDEDSKSSLNDLLFVIGVAIMAKGCLMCSLPKPKRHHDVIKAMAASGMDVPIIGEQGFILSNGSFADRKYARKVAEQSGQLLERASSGPDLFSECVW
jgi:hypothetical protein